MRFTASPGLEQVRERLVRLGAVPERVLGPRHAREPRSRVGDLRALGQRLGIAALQQAQGRPGTGGQLRPRVDLRNALHGRLRRQVVAQRHLAGCQNAEVREVEAIEPESRLRGPD